MVYLQLIPIWHFKRGARGTTASPVESRKTFLQLGGFELFDKIGEDERGWLYKGRDRRKRLVLVRSLRKSVSLAVPPPSSGSRKNSSGSSIRRLCRSLS